MGYEGQIAGAGDAPPGHLLRAALVRLIQARSAAERHAKAGELAERLTEYHLINVDAADTPSVPTYRGEGQCFG